MLRVLPEHSRNGIANDAVGFAIPPVLASIYYEHAIRLADDTGHGVSTLIAYVIAHELGHLLLSPSGHSEIGIMRAHWGPKELRLVVCGWLHFTPAQSRLIRVAAQARMRRESARIIVARSFDYDPAPEIQKPSD
jgi:hypothetical protein